MAARIGVPFQGEKWVPVMGPVSVLSTALNCFSSDLRMMNSGQQAMFNMYIPHLSYAKANAHGQVVKD